MSHERFGVRQVMDLTLFSKETYKPELFLNTLKMSNMDLTNETVYATGGDSNARLLSWDYDKRVTFNCQDALLNPKAIAMQQGTQVQTVTNQVILERELLVTEDDGAGDSQFTLANEPVGITAKDLSVFDSNQAGTDLSTPIDNSQITQDDTDPTIFTVPSAELEIGSDIVVYYNYEKATDSEVININSDQFGGYYKAIGNTVWRNEQTGKDELVQIVIPKVKVTTSFSMNMQPDGDPAVFDFNLEVFKDSESNNMVQMIRH